MKLTKNKSTVTGEHSSREFMLAVRTVQGCSPGLPETDVVGQLVVWGSSEERKSRRLIKPKGVWGVEGKEHNQRWACQSAYIKECSGQQGVHLTADRIPRNPAPLTCRVHSRLEATR